MLVRLDDGTWLDPRHVVSVCVIRGDKAVERRIEVGLVGCEEPLLFNVDDGEDANRLAARWAEAINAARSVPARL